MKVCIKVLAAERDEDRLYFFQVEKGSSGDLVDVFKREVAVKKWLRACGCMEGRQSEVVDGEAEVVSVFVEGFGPKMIKSDLSQLSLRKLACMFYSFTICSKSLCFNCNSLFSDMCSCCRQPIESWSSILRSSAAVSPCWVFPLAPASHSKWLLTPKL